MSVNYFVLLTSCFFLKGANFEKCFIFWSMSAQFSRFSLGQISYFFYHNLSIFVHVWLNASHVDSPTRGGYKKCYCMSLCVIFTLTIIYTHIQYSRVHRILLKYKCCKFSTMLLLQCILFSLDVFCYHKKKNGG